VLCARLVARARHCAAEGFAAATIQLPGSGDRPRWAAAEQARADLRRALEAGEPVSDTLILPLVDRAVPEWQASFAVLVYYAVANASAWTLTTAERRPPRAVPRHRPGRLPHAGRGPAPEFGHRRDRCADRRCAPLRLRRRHGFLTPGRRAARSDRLCIIGLHRRRRELVHLVHQLGLHDR
jgi:hypothetical protein